MKIGWLRVRKAPYSTGAAALVLSLGLAAGAAAALAPPASASTQAALLASHRCTAKTAHKKVTVDATNALKFSPASVCLKKGGTVTWRNTGSVSHTTTDSSKLAANASDAALPAHGKGWNHPLLAGKSWSHKFKVVGTYKYFCVPHETLGMLGTIHVVK